MNVGNTINNLSLCSGGAGLDIGLELVLPNLRTVCWVEWEAFAIDFLATRMEEGCLSPAPIWTDLRTFDGQPWRGTVDCLTAGYPCQPFSTAGKRGGENDPRHLWPDVRRVISEAQPGIVFTENVSGHTSLGGEQVVSDLQGMGYEVAAGLFTAAEVNASHKRERFFILGLADTPSSRRGRRENAGASSRYEAANKSRCTKPERSCTSVGYPEQRCTDERATRWPSSPFPPGPDEIEQWQKVEKFLWPALKPGVCELVDGLAADRTRWLKLLGNGVVPLQAAYAFISLWSVIQNRA